MPDTIKAAESDAAETSACTESGLQHTQVEGEPRTEYAHDRDYRFWSIIVALCTMQILCSLENTVIVTSLPTIVNHLGLGTSYIWVTNIFFLASSVVQPLTGQLAGLFGRRHVALSFVVLYTLGSAVCGGANGPAMLIAGRAVQGAGSGGMTAIMGIVISDLVPLRIRSNYQAILAITYAFGMAIGPVVGGAIVQNTSWRWVFFINLPVCGISFSLLWLFLRVKWDRKTNTASSIRESYICHRLYGHLRHFNAKLLDFFFLPLYFQAVRLSTPTPSGVQILPITLIAIPGAAIGAVALSKWGRYKQLHIIGFALLAAGIGSFSTLNKDSSTAEWICLQIVPSVGAGMILDTLLPAVQAGVGEADSAAATASWSFVRSFGNIWGVAIPGAIFNIYSGRYAADIIGDSTAMLSLQNGNVYSSATRDFVESFSEPTRGQIIQVFTKALSKVFLIGILFPVLSFILSFFEREVKLRKVLETEFELEDKQKAKFDENL